MQKLYKSRARRGKRRATIKRVDAEAIQIKGEAIQIKGPQREEKGDNKESGCKCYTNQGHAEGGFNHKFSLS